MGANSEESLLPRSEAEQRVLARGWLADQLPGLQTAILARARTAKYRSGQFLHHAGDGPGGIHGIVRGAIGAHVPTPGGDLVLATVLYPGVWFGYGPLVRDQKRSLSFSVIEDAELFFVSLVEMQAIGRLSPEFQRGILAMTEYGMDVALASLACLLLRRPEQRIAATLQRLAAGRPPFGGETAEPLRITQSQLGEMANVDRRLVNRVLKRIASTGAVAPTYGQIAILDHDALAAIAQTD